MKILMLSYLIFGDTIGGVENHILFVSQELIKMGHTVEIIKPVWEDETSGDSITHKGIIIHHVNVGKRPNIFKLKILNKIPFLKGFLSKIVFLMRSKLISTRTIAQNADIVWQHDFSSNWLSTYYISKAVPVILTNHTGEYLLLKKIPGFKKIEPIFFKHYSCIIGPSVELTPSLQKAITIHNGVDSSIFNNSQSKPSDVDNVSRIFCPRRWAPTKGVKYFAESLVLLDSTEYADRIEVYFAGNNYDVYPTYVEEIKQVLLQIKNIKIHLLGNIQVDEMAEIYKKCDVVVIPSLMEAVSLSALEAMASGCLVISTDVGGMPELITDGVDGYLVKPKNANALSKAIEVAICKDNSHIVHKGYIKATEMYSWAGVSSRAMKFIEERI